MKRLSLVLTATALVSASALEAVQVPPQRRARYGDAEMFVTSLKDGGARAVSKFPSHATETLTAQSGQHLNVVFEIADEEGNALKPHQSFVRLTNKETKVSTYFVAEPTTSAVGDKKGAHKLSLDLSDRKSLYSAADAGMYDVFVIVGDAAISNPVEWRIGTVSLVPAEAPAKSPEILYSKPLLHESDTTRKPLKEIEHIFRAPEKRAPAIVSTAATVAVLGAFGVWVLTAMGLGLRLSLPATAIHWAAGFYSSFLAVLLLFAAYWLDYLRMFRTLGLLSVLAAPLAVCGRKLALALQKRDDATAKSD